MELELNNGLALGMPVFDCIYTFQSKYGSNSKLAQGLYFPVTTSLCAYILVPSRLLLPNKYGPSFRPDCSVDQ